ncbi:MULTISPECIES: hypothetical protein [Rhizobium]|nr:MULTISPECIES: hypothetical protein [Rhizobium]MDH6202320.1 hypothetical protein [Rhizobium leguminosarum]
MPRRRRGSSKAPKLGGPILWFLLIAGICGAIFGEKPTQSVSAPPVHQLPNSAGAAAPQDKRNSDLARGGGSGSGNAPFSGNADTNQIGQEAIATTEVPAAAEYPNDKVREVILLGSKGEWSQIRDKLTRREGWISTSLLSDRKPEQKAEPEDEKRDDLPREPTVSTPRISDATIAQRIIAQSLSMYPGSCACPYNTDRGGRRCGKRSAYNRGGGYAPICFAGDISREMIAAFRKQDGQ